MVKKTTKKPAAKRTAKSVAAKKPAVSRARTAKRDTVDYYPNRMTVAISALAGTILVLLAIITVLGSR